MNRGTLSRRQLLTFDRAARRPEADHWIRIQRVAMACQFEVVLPGDRPEHIPAARLALDEADCLEAQLSVFRDTSELAAINRTAADRAVRVDPALFDLLDLCRRITEDTGGAFDITSTPLSRCWGFLRRLGRVPSIEEIDAAAALVGMAKVTLDRRTQSVHFQRRGVELNLGSIGKGHALDCMASTLAAHGVADALLSAGGSSVLAIGGGSRGWPIDLRPKRVARDRIGRVHLRGGALATSGAGEQYVDAGGRRYGHVIDPRTGWTASGVLSASVVTSSAASADALSTAFLVAGPACARHYCARHADTLVILTEDTQSQSTQVIGRFHAADVEIVRCT